MILQALVRYYEDLTKQGKIARPGWAKSKINYALCINERGELEQVIPLLEDTGGKKPQPQQFDLPAVVKRASNIASNFLWDNSGYLLGVDAKGKPERSRDCFEACKQLHHQLLDGVDSTAAQSVLAFLDSWEPSKAREHPALQTDYDAITSGGNLLFRVNGVFAQEDEAIRRAWQAHYDQSKGERQQCLVTGKLAPIARLHPAIKGVDGAQTSGGNIVAFNKDNPATCSFGKTQSYNAPVSEYAAFAYTAALNHLLADRENVQKIGDTTVVCWAEGAEPQYQAFTFAALFGKTRETLSEGDVRDAVKKLANGQRVPELDLKPNQLFYILGLSPNAARLSVRFFYQGSFGDLMKNINAHHERMEIVRPSFDKYETIPIWAMLRETVKSPPKGKSWPEASPVLAGATARAIFTGGLYPAALLEQTMLRIRAERDISRGKAAIIKAYYLRKHEDLSVISVLEGAMEERLNESCAYLPYLLGRLFAVMEKIQIDSVGGKENINRTIKDSYFVSAASTPASIFNKLFPLNEYHMNKLKRDNPGLGVVRTKEKEGIINGINEMIPSRFTAEESNAFYIGYYHQTQSFYEKKEEK